MGGYNSGGHNRRGHPTTEQCSKLRIRDMKASGMLRPGTQGKADLGRGLCLLLESAEDGVTVELKRNKRICWSVYLAVENCPRPFGGAQAYFFCPKCGDRRTELFFYREWFLCRVCHRLPYQSQRLRGYERLLRRARKSEAALRGISENDCIGMDAPPRPKGMRRRTYWRLLEPILEAMNGFEAEVFRRFGSSY